MTKEEIKAAFGFFRTVQIQESNSTDFTNADSVLKKGKRERLFLKFEIYVEFCVNEIQVLRARNANLLHENARLESENRKLQSERDGLIERISG